MTGKKVLSIAALLIVVGGIYFYLFGGSLRRRELQMHVSIRPRVGARPRQPGTAVNNQPLPRMIAVVFDGGPRALSSVEVYQADELATNKDAKPVWHLVSETNSAPVEDFVYGWQIRGMHPAVKGARAQALQPDTTYRVVVHSGSIEGHHDFKTPPEDAPALR